MSKPGETGAGCCGSVLLGRTCFFTFCFHGRYFVLNNRMLTIFDDKAAMSRAPKASIVLDDCSVVITDSETCYEFRLSTPETVSWWPPVSSVNAGADPDMCGVMSGCTPDCTRSSVCVFASRCFGEEPCFVGGGTSHW